MKHFAVIALVVAGCAGAATTQKDVVSQNGCTVNLKAVCQQVFDQPVLHINGIEYDRQRLEQSGSRHLDVAVPFTYPDGSVLATVQCQYDTQTHRVVHASLAGGPPIDEKAVAYVKSQGFCEENGAPGKLAGTP